MKDIKQLMITLVALLAVTTGAWATETTVTWVITDFYDTGSAAFTKYDVTVTPSNNDARYSNFFYNNGSNTFTTTLGNFTKIEIVFEPESSPVTVSGWDYELIEAVQPDPVEMPDIWSYTSKLTWTGDAESVSIQGNVYYIKSITFTIAEPPSGPKVAWDGDKKTGSFTMPGGNVTLEPEYYPQATVADGGVTAADADARATTDDPLVKVDATKLTGAKKLMYFVSNSGTTAPAYDAEGWTDQLPTAEGFTQQGIVYVWYYPVGTDEGVDGATATYSDGDIMPLGTNGLVTIAAAPTYAVTFADDTAEPTLWTADPATDVTKGQTVTVTYTGTKKVIGVKAEKKAPVTYPLLSAATTSDYGKVVCADGHLHDAKTAVPDGCTAVGILGKVTETGHGLILALKDATSQEWNTINGWTSVNSYAGTTLKQLPAGALGNLTSYTALGETAVSNWAVAQKSDYDAIFTNLGSTTGNDNGKTYDYNVNAYITTGVGGTAIDGSYWSATENGGNYAWYFRSGKWSSDNKGESYNVRPVLGF